MQDGEHYQRIGLIRVSSWNRTRAAAVGNSDPPMVYVDGEDRPIEEEFAWGDESPLWLQGATKRTVTIS